MFRAVPDSTLPGLSSYRETCHFCCSDRDEYTTVDLPGGVAGTFKLKGKEYLRTDIQLVRHPAYKSTLVHAASPPSCNIYVTQAQENSQKQQIKCSHLLPKYPPESLEGRMPCVVYCHCNSGSRRDSEEALHLLLPQNISVFALDFVVSPLLYLCNSMICMTLCGRIMCVSCNYQHYLPAGFWTV